MRGASHFRGDVVQAAVTCNSEMVEDVAILELRLNFQA